MRVHRFEEAPSPGEVRGIVERPRSVEADVRGVLEEVRDGGDAAIRRLTARFDRVDVPPERLRVGERELDAAPTALDARLTDAIKAVIANVRAVARAQLNEGVALELGDGQRVDVLEFPVRRAGAYVPGGRAPYPSSLVMCAATARAAGVEELAVCAPPDREGRPHPVILATAALCGVREVYLMGGSQAVAALAYGTETVRAVDVIVGPGNAYVQEAKRQLVGRVGIDGVAGPTELVVVASPGAEAELVALDVLAQAEHGPDSLLVVISSDTRLLDEVERGVGQRTGTVGITGALGPRGLPRTVAETPLALVEVPETRTGVQLADAIAPEHLQLIGQEAESLAGEVRAAGCLFVGPEAGTAFGDYVAGSNHVLPTGGAARFASALSPATFRRRMARVSLPGQAARRLAPSGVALAAAEGFPIHGESMARRA
jgi:histidinol dehydrogenase